MLTLRSTASSSSAAQCASDCLLWNIFHTSFDTSDQDLKEIALLTLNEFICHSPKQIEKSLLPIVVSFLKEENVHVCRAASASVKKFILGPCW